MVQKNQRLVPNKTLSFFVYYLFLPPNTYFPLFYSTVFTYVLLYVRISSYALQPRLDFVSVSVSVSVSICIFNLYFLSALSIQPTCFFLLIFLYFFYSHLFYCTIISSHLIYSLLLYSLLFYSHLLSSLLFYSLLIYSLLIYSHLSSSILFSSISLMLFLVFCSILYYCVLYRST